MSLLSEKLIAIMVRTCPDCNGTGYDFSDGGQCDRCNGTGEIGD